MNIIIELGTSSTIPLSSSPVRISGFHPDDPGSNPGNGNFYLVSLFFAFFFSVTVYLHFLLWHTTVSMYSYCSQRFFLSLFIYIFTQTHLFFSLLCIGWRTGLFQCTVTATSVDEQQLNRLVKTSEDFISGRDDYTNIRR